MAEVFDQTAWRRLKDLYFVASELTGDERRTFLDTQCPLGDPLRDQLDRLLSLNWDDIDGGLSRLEERLLGPQFEDIARIAAESRDDPKSNPVVASSLSKAPLAANLGLWGELILNEEIGQGSFGTVYRGHDPRLDRPVAVKLLRRTAATDEQLTSRLLTEARALARVRHSNVVAVYEAGEHEGRFGLSMEFIRGLTLEQLLDSHGAFSADETRLLGHELCGALAAVHHVDLVHRDIKAQNVMREVGGRLVLMDFGGGQTQGERGTSTPWLVGTPFYLAPEVLSGKEATIRSDIYSLGVLLYHLVTKDFPVKAATLDDLVRAHAHGEIAPLQDVRPNLPVSFARVVERAIHPDPTKRFHNAVRMAAALAQIPGSHVNAQPIARLRAPAKRTRRTGQVLYDLSEAGLPDSSRLQTSLDSKPNNLPVPPTTFVGRQRQLQEVRALLLRTDTHLLTLSGAGGSGKTRLAIEAARGLLGNFSHGVFLIELAGVSDPDLTVSIIIQTLRLAEFGSKTPLDTLEHHLAQRDMLLVLDNFEQILRASDQVLQLLNHCPKLKVLVTSREPLNVRLERQYVVPPLELPGRIVPPDVQSLEAIESVRLFIDRVRANDHKFKLTAANAAAVCAICLRLDGLPLALELAASWLTLFTPQSLLEHLKQSMELLTEGPAELADHQRTLKDTIAWSYNMLNAHEQLTFRRMSVVVGGCSPDSAAAIASDGRQPADVLRDLRSLVRKNLVTHTPVEGEIRLGMLETIRDFGNRRLEDTTEHIEVRRRHAEYYLALAEEMAEGLVGRQQQRFVRSLLAEQDNLRAAFAWAIEQGRLDMTSRFLEALLWLWIPRGHFAEGRSWTRRALNEFANVGSVREVGVILRAAGWLEVLAGDYPAALPLFQSSYDIFHALQDPADRARANITLGVTCLVLGDERGVELSDRAVVLCRTSGHQGDIALALFSAGIKLHLSGNSAEAIAMYNEALQAFYAADNIFWPGQLLRNLALLRLQEGDWKQAADLAAEALNIGREYEYPMIRNLSLATLGSVAVAMGTPILAAQLFGAVHASLSELGVTFEPPDHAALQQDIAATKALIEAENYEAAYEQGCRWGDTEVDAAVRSLREQ